jgi:hypothetical protein
MASVTLPQAARLPFIFDSIGAIQEYANEGSQWRLEDAALLSTQGRLQLAAAVSDALAAYPFVMPNQLSLATYAVEDVLGNAVLGWKVLGSGVSGVAVGGCLRQTPVADDRARDELPYKRADAWEDAALGKRILTVQGQRDLCKPAIVSFVTDVRVPAHSARATAMMTVVKMTVINDPLMVSILFAKGGFAGGRQLVSTRAAQARLPDATDQTPEATAIRENEQFAVWLMQARDRPFREVLAHIYANLLVAANATPHLSLFHHAMLTRAESGNVEMMLERGGGIAPLSYLPAQSQASMNSRITEQLKTRLSLLTVSELCDISLKSFLHALHTANVSEDRRTQLYRTILFQCVQALTAMEENAHLRHNDLHYDNVMLSFVPAEAIYTYATGAGSCAVVPTYGISVRIIDFGRCTSDVIFGEGDTSRGYVFTNTIRSWLQTEPFRTMFLKHLNRLSSMTCFDIARLCTHLTLFGDPMLDSAAEDVLSLVLAAAVPPQGDGVVEQATATTPAPTLRIGKIPAYWNHGKRQPGVLPTVMDVLAKRWGFHRDYDISTAKQMLTAHNGSAVFETTAGGSYFAPPNMEAIFQFLNRRSP